MIAGGLATHLATVTRQGTRTSDAGDTVPNGVYVATSIVAQPCIVEQVGGDSEAAVLRARSRASWTVLLDPGLDVRTRDHVLLTGLTGSVVEAMVTEVRRFDGPKQVAHMRLTCLEVTG